MWHWRDPLLGLFPVGSTHQTFPLPSIAAIRVDTQVKVAGLVVGLLAVLFGAFVADLGISPPPSSYRSIDPLTELVFGALLAGIGAYLVISAWQCRISVTNNGGQAAHVGVAFANRRAARTFASKVAQALATLDVRGRSAG